MKVVFLQDLTEQKIKKDDVRDVSDGYARNFLFPKKLAVPATSAAVELAHVHALKHEREQRKTVGELKAKQEKLRGMTLEFAERSHEGKLYGGIGAERIAAALAKHGIVLDAKHIHLEHPIKLVGEHAVVVKLGDGVEGEVTVRVSEEISNS